MLALNFFKLIDLATWCELLLINDMYKISLL